MWKKTLMELMWRLQASQTVIGIIFWPLTLTGIFYPYVRERTNNFGLGHEAVLQGMGFLFLLLVMFIVMFGLMFDKLRFWKEQNIVAVERNPYMSYKLTAKEIYWIKIWTMSMRANPDLDSEMKKELALIEMWTEYNLREDKILSREVKQLETIVYSKPSAKKKTPN